LQVIADQRYINASITNWGNAWGQACVVALIAQ